MSLHNKDAVLMHAEEQWNCWVTSHQFTANVTLRARSPDPASMQSGYGVCFFGGLSNPYHVSLHLLSVQIDAS